MVPRVISGWKTAQPKALEWYRVSWKSWEAQTCMGNAYTTISIGHRWGKSRHATQIEGRKSSPALGLFFFFLIVRLASKKRWVL